MNGINEIALNHMRAAFSAAADAAKAAENAVEAMKNDGTINPSEIAEFYFYLRELYESLDDQAKRIYHAQDTLNKFLIPERLRANNMDAIRVPSVARSFSITTKTSASLIDKEKGFDWLRSIGQGDIIQETVNAGTLAALCRNLILEQGIDPPPEIVKVSTYNTTSMVKYRPKEGA